MMKILILNYRKVARVIPCKRQLYETRKEKSRFEKTSNY